MYFIVYPLSSFRTAFNADLQKLTSDVLQWSLFASVLLTAHRDDEGCKHEISNSQLSRRQEQPSDNSWP